MTQPQYPYGPPIGQPTQPNSAAFGYQNTPSGQPWMGTQVGRFGQTSAQNIANGTAGNGAAGIGDPYLPPAGHGQPPQIGNMQDYGDYQNFGSIAQNYGAAGASQLNTPGVTGSLDLTQSGARGTLHGQQVQNAATGLLGQAAQGRVPSAAEIQQRQGIEQGLSQAQAQAASTRGNFGLANAQKQAMAAQATGANVGAASGAALRANEMAQARGQYAQAAGAQANNQVSAAQLNAAAQAQNQGTNLGYLTGQQAAYQNQANTALGAGEAQGNLDIGQAAQNNQAQIAQNQLTQGYVGAGSQAFGTLLTAGALMSDERMKRDIRPAGEIMSQLDHFHPVSFNYKAASDTPNQQAADAPQVGVLAQDVERGPAGRMLVQHGPQGEKYLHVPSMVGAMAAGEGALKQRADNHEARLLKLEQLLRGGGAHAAA
jgi:hypothetical protein